ncbi:hypothetical protein AVEN_76502-1 [Araneus ventricosus]|uniref:Uncharacterized protein n=1 Tax=Araneus ventricosus TaxID=182803 RepID=A0A4Y2CDN4_ARAVE|nr:hypothetical protein AVEN_76502-1 [Araneus ventricosus]
MTMFYYRKLANLAFSKYPGDLNDSPHDVNTETESGVLIAITGYGPTPPIGGTSRHRSGRNSTPHPLESENPLAYQRTRGFNNVS